MTTRVIGTGTDRRRGREALEVVGTQRVDQGIGLHAVTADELLEEAVLQRLAQDGHAGAVPIVDEHQRIGTPASELGELRRSEEHTSELQSLMRISYAVFCLKKKKNTRTTTSQAQDSTTRPQSTYTK